MSVKIKRSSLGSSEGEIVASLKFEPVNTFVKKSRYSKTQDLKPVYCYSVEEGSDYIRLPLYFCMKKWGLSNDSSVLHGCVEVKQKPGKVLRPYQVSIVNNVVTDLNENRVTLIKSLPGSGKTIMAIVLSIGMKKRTLVLIENLSLSGQWVNAIEEFSTHTYWVVGESKCPTVYPSIIVCHIQRYAKVPREIADTIGFMIMDECPRLCNQQGVDAMSWFSPSHIVGLSATPSRSRDGMYVVMEQFIGNRMVEYSYPINIDVNKIKTGFRPDRSDPNGGWVKMIQSILYNEERDLLIAKLVDNYLSRGYKIMILTTEKGHVENMSGLLTKRGVVHDSYYGKKKTYNNSQVLIANTQKASIGFDEGGKSCVGFDGTRIDCVIFASSVASPENIIQAAGRGFRSIKTKPCVVHIVDNDGVFEKHFSTAISSYKEFDCVVSLKILSPSEALRVKDKVPKAVITN